MNETVTSTEPPAERRRYTGMHLVRFGDAAAFTLGGNSGIACDLATKDYTPQFLR